MRGDEYSTLAWAQFKAAVDTALLTDKDRLSEDDFKTTFLEAAVRDLQHYIPGMRDGHEAVYHKSDLIDVGDASRGTLPPGKLQEVTITQFCAAEDPATEEQFTNAWPVDEFPWARRKELEYGLATVSHGRGYIAFDRESATFWLYPRIQDDMVATLVWNGIRETWADTDATPFTKDCALAAAFYIRAEMRRDVDEEQALFASYRNSYNLERRKLLREYTDRAQVAHH